MTFHDIADIVRMDGKTVIVTGGSKGIGEGCAKVFLAAGANVVICARGAADGEKKAEEFRKEYGEDRCIFIKCDVSNEEDVKNAIEKTVEKYGRIDSLVNNAGWHPPFEKVDDVSVEDFEELIRTNLSSIFMASKYALPYLRQTKGTIVNMSSLVGSMGQRNAVRYIATKGGIHAMTRAMAIDEAPYGVRVNSISPGSIVTPLAAVYFETVEDPERERTAVASQMHLNRQGDIYECGTVALFLASDMSTYLTGIDINVSGGAELGYGIREVAHPEERI